MNLFHSGNKGKYQTSAFAVSIKNSVASSKELFDKLSSKSSYSQMSSEWMELDSKDKELYLTEHHEFAHHGLLHSSPLGVLQWRIEHVLFRDIDFISSQLRRFKIDIPTDTFIYDWLESEIFEIACSRAGVHHIGIREGQNIVNRIKDLLLLKQTLFAERIKDQKSDVNIEIGEFLGLINRCFEYMAERCSLEFSREFTSDLPTDQLLFTEEIPYNARDMIEVHAMLEEIWLLRAFNDIEGAIKRIEQIEEQSYAKCFSYIKEHFLTKDGVGISIVPMQEVILLSCCSALELSTFDSTEDLKIEDHIPWLRLKKILSKKQKDGLDTTEFKESIKCLVDLTRKPLFNSGSQWLQYRRIDFPNIKENNFEAGDYLNSLFNNAFSLGVEAHAHLIHTGVKANIDYLMEVLKSNPSPVNRFVSDKWRKNTKFNLAIIEYEDALWTSDNLFSIEEFLPKSHAIRKDDSYNYLKAPYMPIIGMILVSATLARSIGTYLSQWIPRIETISEKLLKTVDDDFSSYGREDKQIVDGLKKMIDMYLNSMYNNVTYVPFGGQHSSFSDHGFFY